MAGYDPNVGKMWPEIEMAGVYKRVAASKIQSLEKVYFT